jgi:uncharacterized protein with FMN-binding domain
MRRIVVWFMSTVTVVVLLFGYSTSTSGPAAVGGQSSAVAAGHPVNGGTSSSTSSASARTVSGPTVPTQWGDVQVVLTVDGSRITDVSVPVYPNGNGTDAQINAYALPILIQDTLNAQSAHIDMITGATVTSGGYLQSLQGALDKAGL